MPLHGCGWLAAKRRQNAALNRQQIPRERLEAFDVTKCNKLSETETGHSVPFRRNYRKIPRQGNILHQLQWTAATQIAGVQMDLRALHFNSSLPRVGPWQTEQISPEPVLWFTLCSLCYLWMSNRRGRCPPTRARRPRTTTTTTTSCNACREQQNIVNFFVLLGHAKLATTHPPPHLRYSLSFAELTRQVFFGGSRAELDVQLGLGVLALQLLLVDRACLPRESAPVQVALYGSPCGQVGASEKKTEKMEDTCHTGTKKRLVLLLAHTYVHPNIRAAQSHGQKHTLDGR